MDLFFKTRRNLDSLRIDINLLQRKNPKTGETFTIKKYTPDYLHKCFSHIQSKKIILYTIGFIDEEAYKFLDLLVKTLELNNKNVGFIFDDQLVSLSVYIQSLYSGYPYPV